jgi:hypothetical protein
VIRKHIETAYIVGAGLSHHAGLPLQTQFTERLLEQRFDKHHPDYNLQQYIAEFIHVVFDHNKKASAKYWPMLEDLFTRIDLSANSGHHLSDKYTPADLRTIRRALLTIIIGVLAKDYGIARRRAPLEWNGLSHFIKNVTASNSAFISMNWDTAIEQQMSAVKSINNFDYRCGAEAAEFSIKPGMIVKREGLTRSIQIIKMHGSINWLYCDNCRRVHWFPPECSDRIANQLLNKTEWAHIDSSRKVVGQLHCKYCPRVVLGTRLATFSYLKALEFPMFQKSWLAAEAALNSARRWVFIGYSLPDADYQFKYLLKRSQVSRRNRPEIILVTGGDNPDATYRNYQRFFGRSMSKKRSDGRYYKNGLDNEAIEMIT